MKPKITVIGVGRLGLSFALLVNSKGYEVVGCDVNERYVKSLNRKTFSSKEPYINEMLKNSKMEFTSNTKEALEYGDIIFVFVPTPSKESGAYNHKYVEQIVSKIEKYQIINKTLVIGCTVMPRYTDSIQRKLSPLNINVVYNPEFIAQGNIIEGLKNADIVLIGGDNITTDLFDIYNEIMDRQPVFKILTPTGAEIAKISINCFLVMKIAYANLIGEICNNTWEEENRESILDAIGSDSRIGNKCLSYGFPAGGVCLPRDGKALNYHAYFAGLDPKIFHAIENENERHLQYLVKYYKEKNQNKEVPFVFSYLGYKKGVDILTDSFQLKLCIELLREGYKVNVPEPIKDMDTPEEFKDFIYNDMVSFDDSIDGYKIN